LFNPLFFSNSGEKNVTFACKAKNHELPRIKKKKKKNYAKREGRIKRSKVQKTLLTSTPTLSRITADTAGVESNPFRPTQIRLTPFAAAILVIIYRFMKIINDVQFNTILL
jgi:hypothetical protein